MNPNVNYNFEQYKQCAGKDCKSEGKTLLKIKYLQKNGYFCDFCKAELLELELTVQGEENTIDRR
jgi:hypothetical protein